MNLAVHGLGGEIRQANTYYEDPHDSVGRFDFVMANPPFNVNAIDKDQASRTTSASRSGSRAPTTATTSGSRSSTRRSTTRPCRVRDGQLRLRRPRLRTGDPPQADRRPSGRRDGLGRLELLLHRHPAVTLWFLDKGKRDTDRADTGAVHRRPPDLPPDRPRPPRLPPEQHRVPRQHRPPLPRRRTRVPPTAPKRC